MGFKIIPSASCGIGDLSKLNVSIPMQPVMGDPVIGESPRGGESLSTPAIIFPLEWIPGLDLPPLAPPTRGALKSQRV